MLDNILIKRRGERRKSKNTTFFKFFELFCVFLCSAPRFSIIIKEKRLRNNEQFMQMFHVKHLQFPTGKNDINRKTRLLQLFEIFNFLCNTKFIIGIFLL